MSRHDESTTTHAVGGDNVSVSRGRLRIYLGAAPGVGKTYAMLGEAHRRVARGTDMVVGYVETHHRSQTAAMLTGLEVVPRRTVEHRGARFEEIDLDAVLARRPEVALIDELAHTNVPGSRHAKRWQDVEVLLDAGIDVISTVNIQHLESLNDVVESITGVRQRETVPDAVVRAADQIELVDMSPESLRRRLAHGNVYSSEKVDAALAHYFRVGNLTALRELALLWVADRVEEGLERYRADHGIEATWAARQRIVVALTGGPEGATLLRRGAGIAGRSAGRVLVAVHVVRGDGTVGASPDDIARLRQLTEDLAGSFHTVVGDDVAGAVLEFARSVNGTQVVVGASRRGRVSMALRPSTAEEIVRDSGDIDVHVVTHEDAGARITRATPARRRNPATLVVGRGRAPARGADRAAAALPRRTEPHDGAAGLPPRSGRVVPRRRSGSRDRHRARGEPARELVLHAALPPPHDRRSRRTSSRSSSSSPSAPSSQPSSTAVPRGRRRQPDAGPRRTCSRRCRPASCVARTAYAPCSTRPARPSG